MTWVRGRSRSIIATICAAACVLLFATAMLRAREPAARYRITRGGTYSGEYVSDDPGLAIISIETSDPVIIENSTLRGRGNLIVSHYHHADLTIRNCVGSGAGRFAHIEGFNRLAIEHCRLDGTRGIYLLDYAGNRTPEQSIRIAWNQARNIDGRRPDGKQDLVQFLQLDKVRHVAAVEIFFNEIINEPAKSCVEDNISIYLSSGTKESPIKIHDNFIRGAYPADPLAKGYSGGGIMLGDGVGKTADDDSHFVEAFANQVIDTSNYGIAISAGHDCTMYYNRIVSAGVLPDGTKIPAQNVGAYVWDSYKAGKQHFFNNRGHDNVIGWVNKDGRNDWWRPGAAAWENNQNWPAPITRDVYDEERKRWQEKLSNAGITVGPTSPPVAPAAATATMPTTFSSTRP